jgi:hypothetical protein
MKKLKARVLELYPHQPKWLQEVIYKQTKGIVEGDSEQYRDDNLIFTLDEQILIEIAGYWERFVELRGIAGDDYEKRVRLLLVEILKDMIINKEE